MYIIVTPKFDWAFGPFASEEAARAYWLRKGHPGVQWTIVAIEKSGRFQHLPERVDPEGLEDTYRETILEPKVEEKGGWPWWIVPTGIVALGLLFLWLILPGA